MEVGTFFEAGGRKFIYKWTDGTDGDFIKFSGDMEDYYNRLVGGEDNRKGFVPYNALADIHDVMVVYDEDRPAACASFKGYDERSAEIKRVWVSEEYRGRHISRKMMELLEERAREKGFERAILQTREACVEAVSLYKSLGYAEIVNYPPYDKLELAVCFEKVL